MFHDTVGYIYHIYLHHREIMAIVIHCTVIHITIGANPGFWNGWHRSSAEGASIEAPPSIDGVIEVWGVGVPFLCPLPTKFF